MLLLRFHILQCPGVDAWHNQRCSDRFVRDDISMLCHMEWTGEAISQCEWSLIFYSCTYQAGVCGQCNSIHTGIEEKCSIPKTTAMSVNTFVLHLSALCWHKRWFCPHAPTATRLALTRTCVCLALFLYVECFLFLLCPFPWNIFPC